MALRITDLRIDTKDLGEFILANISPFYEYIDGKKSDKLLGYRYDVALPSKKLEKLGVKVENLTPLIDIENEEIPIGMKIDFHGLEVGSYYMNGNVHVKAKAKSVHIKEDKTNASKKA
ncbi:hypothetical protein [Senegalia massiliensis]|uniref:Uncharacterized protein n=1 Tax=Senegalia massiliensis TaxID=1720316 RepID=A0A845QYQ8_9CLOT|nr:hypothetical protein [Senegalia massiliensis]NBI07290.1 hypothetical protein [Senegalia massiliensis]